VPVIGALSCLMFIIFLSPASWIIGCIGLAMGERGFFSAGFSAGNLLPDLIRPIQFINPDIFRES